MKNYLKGALAATALISSLSAATIAADDYEYWPNAQYQTSIPTLESVLGYKSGERITTHADMIRYFEALAAAAPDRIKLFDYGETWEGRRLIYLAISSPENIAKLDTFKAGMQALSDPRKTSSAEAKKLIDDMPSSTWLAYSVHGNEISSTDAAMMTAYHLLASEGDERVPEILDNSIVFVNPLQNPDGRDRFINRFRTALGMEADSDPISAEHNEPWPSGRTNHYLFDMNRDWISLTQPETKGHVKALQEWYPLVFVDLHEMGGNSTYYFAPEADPYNPHLSGEQRESLYLFGKNNAKWFDNFGYSYFTRDIFDAFYPGYGASWPAYYGAISMTYEQASSRGLVYRRSNGTDLEYRQTVRQHFITSMATAETTAKNREKFLTNFWDYQVSAIDEAKKDKKNRSYIFPASRDKAANRKLAGVLSAQGIEVQQATSNFSACGNTYQAGAFIVDSAQPRKRMIRTLLDPQVNMSGEWVKEQERRRAKNIGHDIYDVTAWSLPIMYNVEMDICGKAVNASSTPAGETLINTASVNTTEASVAYLVPWNDMAAGRLLTSALRKGLRVKIIDEGFRKDGKDYPAGTLIFDVSKNTETLGPDLKAIAEATGAEVVGVNSSWVDSGQDLGSRSVNELVAPKVAIAWDEPTSQYSAGNTRFVVERQFGYPVTAIRPAQLSRADLSRYQVIILPSSWGGYQSALGKRGASNLKEWVRKGGVLIGTGTAVRYLSDKDVGMLSIQREAQVKEKDAGKEKKLKSGRVEGTIFNSLEEMQAATEPTNESPDSVPGVLVRASVDKDHWLSSGLPDTLNVLIRGSDIYTPAQLNSGRNVAWFEGSDALLASGHLWEENRKQYAYKPFVVSERMGRGHVIGFTQDPTVRAYLDGLNMVFFNAIFHGAAQSSPLR
ncbi:M14 family metallopeptidase [Kordiimonas laminariae]|uniref:M14 family metallopeptidase n=1 Tax=Kordiimonas laminariae TaxID=2917717 RepID=UPI001FF1F817|nr:M14 family metallopeptidase [Kordiimonas laminariae]MCK0068645.1 M14 family metallopeptidase [Kordiimonas laminariae]